MLLGGRATARDAAFANGAFGNVLEMDDVHREAILHPGPVVVPAALALAAFAWLIASMVVGITPSSAATTSTAAGCDSPPRSAPERNRW